MSKISVYANATPVATDYVLGDQAIGPTTKTFLFSAISTLILGGNAITAGAGTLSLASHTLLLSADATVSGTNTGDQTSVSGNAGTATALQTARTIGGVSFDGTANITVATATGGFTVSGAPLVVSDATNATDASTGSIHTAGGLGVIKDAFVGGGLTVGGAAAASITGNGAVIALGSVFSLPSVSVAGAMLWVTASIPRMTLVEAAAAADNRVWNVSASGAVFRISATGDAAGTGTAISITRSGSAIGVITVAGTSLVINAPITGQSTQTLGTAAGTTGALSFVGTTSGSVTLTAAAAAGSATFKLPTADGSSGQFMKTDGSGQLSFGAAAGGTTLLTMVAAAGQTSIDFTVPSGVKVMNIMFDQLSTNGTSIVLVQLGDAGGVETSGYVNNTEQCSTATMSGSTSTAGWALDGNGAGATLARSGMMTMTLMDAATFLWTGMGMLKELGTTSFQTTWFTGKKATSQEVTTVRITTVNGTDTFDAGNVNVSYSS